MNGPYTDANGPPGTWWECPQCGLHTNNAARVHMCCPREEYQRFLVPADIPAIAEAVRDLVVEAYQPPPDMNFAKVYGLLMEERKAVEPLRARLARALEVVEAARGLKAADFMTDPMQEGPDDFDLLQQALAALDEGERG
jgi:hypothetical protein